MQMIQFLDENHMIDLVMELSTKIYIIIINYFQKKKNKNANNNL